jgi:iron complex outermembrane recepter protein
MRSASLPLIKACLVATVLVVSDLAPLDAQVPSVPPPDTVAQRIEPQEILAARGQGVIGGAAAVRVRVDSTRLGTNPTVADLLRTLPTVNVRTNSRGEVELSVRGSESRQAALTLNGIPLSPGWDGRADAGLIPLSGVTSLTFVRSSGSLLGGPNAIGGTVDLRIDAPTRPFERSISMGSDQTGARLLSLNAAGLQPRGRDGYTHWSAGAGYRELPGLVRARDVPDATPGATLRTNTDVRSRDLYATGGWDRPSGASVHALVSAYDAERGVAPELHLVAPRLWRYPAQSRVFTKLRAQSAPHAWAAGTTTLEASATFMSGLTRIETFSDDRFATVNGRESGDERVRTLRATGKHVLHAGSELRSAFTVQDIRYDEALDGSAPSRYAQRLWSAGLEGQRVLGERTLLTAGVVVDHGATVESGEKLPNPTRTIPGWRLGATMQLRPTVRLHGSASERARFPALRELYSGSLARFEPNPELQPERLRALEGGMSWGATEAGPGVGVQLVGFAHWLEDGVVRVGFPGTNRFIRVNRDRTEAVGTEVSVGWRGAEGASLRMDLVGQRVRIADQLIGGSGRKPEHLPAVRAMFDATMPVRAGVLLGASVQHLGAQYCVNPETDRDVGLARQTVLGATAERRWRFAGAARHGVRVVLGIDNLSDAAVYEQCGLPRAGRTVRLGVTVD